MDINIIKSKLRNCGNMGRHKIDLIQDKVIMEVEL